MWINDMVSMDKVNKDKASRAKGNKAKGNKDRVNKDRASKGKVSRDSRDKSSRVVNPVRGRGNKVRADHQLAKAHAADQAVRQPDRFKKGTLKAARMATEPEPVAVAHQRHQQPPTSTMPLKPPTWL